MNETSSNPTPATNPVLTASSLTRQYDRYFRVILGNDILKALPRARKQQQKYEVVGALPTKDVYLGERNRHYRTTISDLVSNAYSVFSDLNGELDDWYNNLPDAFRDGDKGSELQEATGTLSNLSEPDMPDVASLITGTHLPDLDAESRSARNGEAVSQLDKAIDLIEAFLADTTLTIEDEGGPRPLTDEEREELSTLKDTLENDKGEAENVSFPGMY